jgi:hypothetical protein
MEFIVKDLLQAAFIQASCNIRVELRPGPDNDAIFVFAETEDVRRAAQSFISDGLIKARTYSRHIGVLRSRCRELRLSRNGPKARTNGLSDNPGDR